MPAGFSDIVERHHEAVYGFILRYVGNTADAEDLCQEVFLRALRKIHRFRGESHVRTWLFAIAANLARDWHRGAGRRKRREVSVEDGVLADHIDNSGPPAVEVAAAKERAEAVRTAIGALPEREKTALLLRVYQGLEYEEIGEAIGCSANAVGSLLCRARKRLAADLRPLAE